MSNSTRNTEDLIDFAKILGQQNNFEEVVRLVANRAAQLFKADLALILMLNPDTRKTVKTIVRDGKLIHQKEYRNIHIHVGGWIINNCRPFLSTNIQNDERFARGLFDSVSAQSVAGVPLTIEGIIIGALVLLYQKPSDFINSELIKSLEKVAAIAVPFLRNTQKIRKYFDSVLSDDSLLIKYNNAGLYGKSARFIKLLYTIEAATKCNSRVLLIGKTGTGKELIAKAIHNCSDRAEFPFIAIDCGAIPATLLESELFGHVRGAFTGAHSDHEGLFLKANGGTLFMDEINNMPYELQSKLLRVLEQGEVRPIGGEKVIKTNVRIIAASSVPLKKLVEDHLFREDLFFRLYVYPIYVPDLGELREDIALLADHFLHLYTKQQNKNIQNFHEEVIDFIKQRIWRGNVRELEHFVERLVTLAPKDIETIDMELFQDDLGKELEQFRKKQISRKQTASLKGQVQDFEAQLIKQTLIACNWNQSEAARRLSTTERNIRYKIEKLNISRPR